MVIYKFWKLNDSREGNIFNIGGTEGGFGFYVPKKKRKIIFSKIKLAPKFSVVVPCFKILNFVSTFV